MSDSTNNSGVGFSGLLTLLFIGLKLTDVIHWSWFWVLSPLILSAALVLVVGVILGLLDLKDAKDSKRVG